MARFKAVAAYDSGVAILIVFGAVCAAAVCWYLFHITSGAIAGFSLAAGASFLTAAIGQAEGLAESEGERCDRAVIARAARRGAGR